MLRKTGVKVLGKRHIYGERHGMFGTEPFLIELGDKEHITGECQFINHDGSTLILRKELPLLEITKSIKIGNDVFVGYRTVIMPGYYLQLMYNWNWFNRK